MSDQDTPMVFKRRAFARDDGNGHSVAEWTLTPVSVTDPVQIIAEPICTVPVIFVPGIMGSNLKVTEDVDDVEKNQPVWLMNSELGAGWDWASVNAKSRQRRLNPKATAVFDGGEVPSHVPTIGDADFIRKKRYWGEVSAMSYQSFLVWLEKTLNERKRTQAWRAELDKPAYAGQLAPGQAFKSLVEGDVAHAAYFRFPVYACGYNWLRSNLEAADTLAKRIKAVIAANNSKSYTCQQVLLVTHSMGGLVARACSELKGMRDKIAGIVHGVMPATGAAVAYKRVRGGTEGIAGMVLGDSAEKVTAVFANSPGALQLLPSQQYGAGWLKIGTGGGRNFVPKVSLPKADPYEEIYKVRGAWWGLVREELIDPAKIDGHEGWDSYVKNIEEASDFHRQLATRYHPNTITFHGDGRDPTKGMTWGTVCWRSLGPSDLRQAGRGRLSGTLPPPMAASAADFMALQCQSDDGEGNVSATHGTSIRYELAISGKDAAGDGTVPVASGCAPVAAGVRATYRVNLDSEGHEGAYRDETVRRLTLHSILAIVQPLSVIE